MTQARDLMTKDVIVVSPGTPTRAIARLLLDHAISAVPVVDASGAPIGMVSEGDLIGRAEADREARRDWWLALAAEKDEVAPKLLARLKNEEQTARDIMSAPVVTVEETTDASEIARLLAAYRIKRVPVIHDGRITGIVSRADILRAFAAAQAPDTEPERHPHAHGLLADALSSLDEAFFGHAHANSDQVSRPPVPDSGEAGLSVADLHALMADFEQHKAAQQDETRRALAEKRRDRVKDLISHHIADQNWQALMHRAREAAERGEKEVMLTRFPSDLCSDRGRAINVSEPDWPATLRGEAAEIYLRWEHELRPRGFHLTARVLDFPNGMPGDIGLFLVWVQ